MVAVSKIEVSDLRKRIENLERLVEMLLKGGCHCASPAWYYANMLGMWRCGYCGAVRSGPLHHREGK